MSITPPTGVLKVINILLVEDDDGDILLTQEALEDAPFESKLHVVHNGEDAIEFISTSEGADLNLIICDLNMPRMDGHEFLVAIKKYPDLNHIPIVILSNSSNPQDFVKSYQLESAMCLSKPLNAEKIEKIITQTRVL